jgi:hypothetical protein
MQCISCEEENPAGARFCSLCGIPMPPQGIVAPASGIICSSCQSLNVAGSFFCYNCGDYFIACDEKTPGNGSEAAAPAAKPPLAQKARATIPGMPDIMLNGKPAFIDRYSFDQTLPHDVLMSISRQHILLTFENGAYYLQDYGRDGSGSTNHTRLNGIDIYRKGRQRLNDGDRIELARQSELTLVFKAS